MATDEGSGTLDADYLAETRRRAENGDHNAARELIDSALGSLQLGVPLPDETKAFLVRAFTKILDGVSAIDALCLKKPRHREGDTFINRDVALAAAVVLRLRAGRKPDDAYFDVAIEHAKQWGLRDDSERTVQRAYESYGAALDAAFPDDVETLHQMALRGPEQK